VNGLDDEARAIALGIADTFQEAKAKAKMAIGHTAGLVWEDLNTINNYLGDPRNGWLGMNPLGRSLQEGVGLTSALLGKIVFHGSPHKFEKFAMSKIGTGEGAQAYGHGLYFAENKGVAEGYKYSTSRPEIMVNGELFKSDAQGVLRNSKGQTIDATQQNFADAATALYGSKANKPLDVLAEEAESYLQTRHGMSGERINAAKQAILSGAVKPEVRGSLYNVDLPDESIAKMLDWDTPLSQQPKEIREAYKAFLKSDIAKAADDSLGGVLSAGKGQFENPTGKDFYGAIYEGIPGMGEGSRAKVSEQLRQLGIPGIKYLDQGSRQAGEGSFNYVVFDEALPKIMKRE
jgi:hypothetical protein